MVKKKNKATGSQAKGALKLMQTAERMFGERGVDGVSLRQIVAAAGQANSSAVQHHFGSKEGLLQAVHDMRLPEIDDARVRLLAIAKDGSDYVSVSQLLRVLYMPVVDNLDDAAQKSFALFSSQLMYMDIDRHPFVYSKVPQPGYQEIESRLAAHFNYLPTSVFRLRLRLGAEIFFASLNEIRRMRDLADNPYPSVDTYWNEILQAIEGLFRLPYTEVKMTN